MTPFLTAKLAGKYVAVDAAGLLMSTLQVNTHSQIVSLFLICCDASLTMFPLLSQKKNLSLHSLLTGRAFSCISWCASESVFPTSC